MCQLNIYANMLKYILIFLVKIIIFLFEILVLCQKLISYIFSNQSKYYISFFWSYVLFFIHIFIYKHTTHYNKISIHTPYSRTPKHLVYNHSFMIQALIHSFHVKIYIKFQILTKFILIKIFHSVLEKCSFIFFGKRKQAKNYSSPNLPKIYCILL